MKKKLVLKPFVIPTLYTIFAFVVIISLFLSIEVIDERENITYVSNSILDEYVPVVSVDEKILKPFTDQNVTISNNYYEYDNDENNESSIIYYENTYIQNTGINYSNESKFDVISVLSGEVIEVDNKQLLGKSVTIRHDNELISVYQSLGEITVKKGDSVQAGQIIGKSGNCELINSSQNNLHFELYFNGTVVNPNTYFNRKLSEF